MFVNILRIYSQNSYNNVIYIVNRSTGDSYRTYMPIYVYDIDKRMRKESYLYAKLHTQTKLQQRLQSSVLAWDIPCTNKSFLNTLSINHSGITRNHFKKNEWMFQIQNCACNTVLYSIYWATRGRGWILKRTACN